MPFHILKVLVGCGGQEPGFKSLGENFHTLLGSKDLVLNI